MLISPSGASCEEKERLQSVSLVADSDYSRATVLLDRRRGIMPGDEYSKMKQFVEEARLRRVEARKALDRHTCSHGC
jgi:hypothetical protein